MNHRSEIKSVKAFCVHRWLVFFSAGVSILLIVPDCALGQQSNKSRQPSGSSSRANVLSASASRTADLKSAAKPEASPVGSGGLISFERINELTGFVPASDAEVSELVARMQAAVKAKDATALRACFDEDECLTRTLAGAALTPLQRSEFARGYRSISPFGLLANQAVRSDADFQFLRVIRRGTALRPVFRDIIAMQVVGYGELVIRADDGGGSRIVDMLTSSGGEYVSIAVRPFSLGPFCSERSPERMPTAGIEAAIIDSADGLFELTMSAASGDAKRALNGFGKMRPPLDNVLGTLVFKCNVAKSIGISEYSDAVLQVVKCHPDTVTSDLMLLDLYKMKKKPIEMMAVADRLMKSQEDPWLNAYRIEGLVTQNRIKEALEAIAAAKAAAPNISDPYVDELAMLMKLKNHQETAQAIETLEKKFGDKVVKLTEFPEFDEFSDSEVGRRFLAKRAGFDF